MKKFKIYVTSTASSFIIINSNYCGLYVDFTDIDLIQCFINGTTLTWQIDYIHDIGDLLAEFDTLEELTNNYPELFI